MISAEGRPPRPADAAHFSLPALTQALVARDDGLPVRVYRVAFDPGCRMNWHRHDAPQLLYGLEGTCVVVNRVGESVAIGPGDLVIVDPHEEHWHGAPPETAGAHLAINLGAETVWLEPSS